MCYAIQGLSQTSRPSSAVCVRRDKPNFKTQSNAKQPSLAANPEDCLLNPGGPNHIAARVAAECCGFSTQTNARAVAQVAQGRLTLAGGSCAPLAPCPASLFLLLFWSVVPRPIVRIAGSFFALGRLNFPHTQSSRMVWWTTARVAVQPSGLGHATLGS